MKPLPCPACQQIMHKQRYEKKLGGDVVLDLCFACQGIWFDEFESLQITPGGIIELFKQIHQHRDDVQQPLGEALRCPHCRDRLLHGLDIAKPGGRFNYHRCLQKHGRFITFGQFMIEKGFVRQLTANEVNTLAARIGSIHCQGCGAPVDIRQHPACPHCRSAIAILDPAAVEQALARYQHAEIQRTTVDVEALGDAIIAREKEKSAEARRRRAERSNPAQSIDAVDLLANGIEFLWQTLRH
jgi:Zn-finger nucleic acid-binding protein